MVTEIRFVAQKSFRFSLLAIGAVLIGLALSAVIAIQSGGLQPTSSVLRTFWEDLKNDTAPGRAILDNFAGMAPTQDDYSVFRQVGEYLLRDSSVHRVAFARETRWPHFAGVTLTSLTAELAGRETRGQPFDHGAIRDLLFRNRSSLRLDLAPLPARGVLVSGGVLDDLMSHHEQTWQEDLAARYSGASGYLVFSRPGFTSDGRHAAIYVELICGATCGGGYYLQLERTSGGWQLISEQEKWVS